MDRQRRAVRMVGREELPVNTQHLILLSPSKLLQTFRKLVQRGEFH